MDFDFYVRVRTCKKRVTGKQPLRIVRNTDNICTDLYILLRPQSELGCLGL